MTAIVNLFAGPGGWEEGLGDHAGEDAAIARAEAPVKVGDDGCDTMRYVVAEVDLGARPGIRWI